MSKINIVKKKKQEKKAIPAFNISSIESIRAVLKWASKLNYPVFIETSRWEADYLSPELISETCKNLSKIYDIDYILHLDRWNDLEFMERCLKAWYDSISAEFWRWLSLEDNIKLSKKARELTNKYDAILEWVMEVVPIVYYKDKMQKHMDITDPKNAQVFIDEVKPDIFCVSIWTQSWWLKDIKEIRFDVLKEISLNNPSLPLILHWWSFLEEDIVKKAINLWITKININSELRYAYTNKLKENIKNNPEEYAPYRLLDWAEEEMQKVVENKIKLFWNL